MKSLFKFALFMWTLCGTVDTTVAFLMYFVPEDRIASTFNSAASYIKILAGFVTFLLDMMLSVLFIQLILHIGAVLESKDEKYMIIARYGLMAVCCGFMDLIFYGLHALVAKPKLQYGEASGYSVLVGVAIWTLLMCLIVMKVKLDRRQTPDLGKPMRSDTSDTQRSTTVLNTPVRSGRQLPMAEGSFTALDVV